MIICTIDRKIPFLIYIANKLPIAKAQVIATNGLFILLILFLFSFCSNHEIGWSLIYNAMSHVYVLNSLTIGDWAKDKIYHM